MGHMTALQILPEVYEKIVVASRAATPHEACGLLAGTDNIISGFYQLTNIDASAEHFNMLPEEQFAAVKDMRNKGLRMMAIWHSHPSTPARMSDEDLKLAFTPDTVYLILSLQHPDNPTLAGFRVIEGKPEKLELNITSSGKNT